MINIAGLTPVDDPSYRYKMPRIVPKVEGRGNGIKTVLVNVADIATALNRDASEITKFFGCELGAQTTMSVEDDRFIVNGAHSTQDLQHFMAKYIESFVLCKNCRLPETHYKIKGGLISQKCLACGSKDPCDMTHKLTTFILKQHKKNKADSESGESKEKRKKDKKAKEAEKGGEDGAEGDEARPSKAKKEKKPKKKREDGDVCSDEVVPDDEEDSESEVIAAAIEQFRHWLQTSESQSSDAAVILAKHQHIAAVAEQLRSIQTLSSLRPSDKIIIFLGAAFTSTSVTDNDVEKHREVLAVLVPKNSDIQQRHLIAAMEWFCAVREKELLRMFPVLLKQLYDQDLIDEDAFFSWHADSTRNEYSADQSLISDDDLLALKDAASPFINWLREAEEEESDEDESEEA
ncbi:unnamed protein product [Symbiodinium microadriaticum]|nr:unnamed protein product [Symbiodinium microadriaticum]